MSRTLLVLGWAVAVVATLANGKVLPVQELDETVDGVAVVATETDSGEVLYAEGPIEKVKDFLGDVRGKVKEGVSVGAEKLKEGVQEGAVRAKEFAGRVKDYVRDRFAKRAPETVIILPQNDGLFPAV